VQFGPALSFKSAGDERRKERYREATTEMMRAIAQLLAEVTWRQDGGQSAGATTSGAASRVGDQSQGGNG
jgi:hypothetical protein